MSLIALILTVLSILALAAPTLAAPTLAETQHRAFDFFWHETNATTGLTKDRAKNGGPGNNGEGIASIASTGYMLAALPIGVEHGWVARRDAYARALTALNFIHDKLPQTHGFYFHFVDWKTGERVWSCELSSIDTALLVLGGLDAGQYWHDTPVQKLAGEIAARVEWHWMQTDGGTKDAELAPAMGWFPDKGFTPSRWQGYNESAYLYLLGLGTPEPNGLKPQSWDAWTFPTTWQEGKVVFGGPSPIFFAQMTAGFFDLRGQLDRQGRDWWMVWHDAHLADQAYCARHTENNTYAAGFWGINASDKPDGYGAQWAQDGHNDGTVSPTAMLAALAFTPTRSQKALGGMGALSGKVWGRYGFCNAFNLDKNWFDADVIGIDLGMMLLLTDDAQSGLTWRLMRGSAFAQRGLVAAGFHAVPAPDAVADTGPAQNGAH